MKQLTLKFKDMRYFHYITDQEGNQIESVYSSSNNPKFSLECLAKIKKGTYKIWDRETNETKNINLKK